MHEVDSWVQIHFASSKTNLCNIAYTPLIVSEHIHPFREEFRSAYGNYANFESFGVIAPLSSESLRVLALIK